MLPPSGGSRRPARRTHGGLTAGEPSRRNPRPWSPKTVSAHPSGSRPRRPERPHNARPAPMGMEASREHVPRLSSAVPYRCSRDFKGSKDTHGCKRGSMPVWPGCGPAGAANPNPGAASVPPRRPVSVGTATGSPSGVGPLFFLFFLQRLHNIARGTYDPFSERLMPPQYVSPDMRGSCPSTRELPPCQKIPAC